MNEKTFSHLHRISSCNQFPDTSYILYMIGVWSAWSSMKLAYHPAQHLEVVNFKCLLKIPSAFMGRFTWKPWNSDSHWLRSSRIFIKPVLPKCRERSTSNSLSHTFPRSLFNPRNQPAYVMMLDFSGQIGHDAERLKVNHEIL